MPLLAEILSQGEEVVTGQVIDTNAAWLSEQLSSLGFIVQRHTTVGDRMDDLEQAFDATARSADLVICTGGLGPTDDDLTAEAVSRASGQPLEFDPIAWEDLKEKYVKYSHIMPQSNRKQVLFPAHSVRLDNDWGTAPGFATLPEFHPEHRALMIFLPGVPKEMRAMFATRVLPLLKEHFKLKVRPLVTLRTTGVGESTLQEKIGMFSLPEASLSYRTILPENHVKIRFEPSVSPERIQEISTQVITKIGRPLFSVHGLPMPLPGIDCLGGGLAEVIGRRLLARGESLAVSESCTGGQVSANCTAIPGASAWFFEGVVTYTNRAKSRLLGVPEEILAANGAVSEPVARAMAEGVRQKAGTTWGLSTTGIAGPGGATPGKPVGTVHIAVSGPHHTHHRLLQLVGDRSRVQSLATAAVLDLLRHTLNS